MININNNITRLMVFLESFGKRTQQIANLCTNINFEICCKLNFMMSDVPLVAIKED